MSGSPVARHYDAVAHHYGALRSRGAAGAIRRAEQRAVLGLARVRPGDRVLDVGCGDGAIMTRLRGRGAQVFGVDASLGMAAACRRAGHPVAVQEMETLGLCGPFDWLLCIGALEFTALPHAVLSGFADLLGPGGRLVLLVPSRSPGGWLLSRYHRRHGITIRCFARREVANLLAAAGLGPPQQWHSTLLAHICSARPSSPPGPPS